jgi:hypothetical protein
MTTLHSSISTFTSPLSDVFTKINHTMNQYFAAKAQKASLAKDIKLLSALDPHMLNDIGMKGFNRLTPAQQESVLLDTIKHA